MIEDIESSHKYLDIEFTIVSKMKLIKTGELPV